MLYVIFIILSQTNSVKTLGYVFGYRNMKKAAILDPTAKKLKFWILLALF